MRVRVRFRYNADSGEVETFVVEDLGGDERAVEHDALHDGVTADVARVIERDALIDEVLPGSAVEVDRSSNDRLDRNENTSASRDVAASE